MEIQEQQEKLVAPEKMVPLVNLELLVYKVHLVNPERKVAQGQLEYRDQRDLKETRVSRVFRDLLAIKAHVVMQENVEKKVRHLMIELKADCFVLLCTCFLYTIGHINCQVQVVL